MRLSPHLNSSPYLISPVHILIGPVNRFKMGRPVTLFMVIALLLCSTFSYAARPEPAFPNHSPAKTQPEDEVVEESCDGVGGEECLMRRSLAIHLDYVYTQKHKKRP